MRLFIAIDLPDSVLNGLQTLLRDLPAGRPCGNDQIHLTLFFLGEVQEKDTEGIISTLDSIRLTPFPLRVEGVGCFPSPHRPRNLWAGFSQSPSLHQLKHHIDAALCPLGFLPDKKPFHPHLTLSRIKNPGVTGVQSYLSQFQNFSLEEFIVENFHLYSSKLTPKGAIYTKVKTFSLA